MNRLLKEVLLVLMVLLLTVIGRMIFGQVMLPHRHAVTAQSVSATNDSLLTNLVAYWKFDEAAAPYSDSISTNDLSLFWWTNLMYSAAKFTNGMIDLKTNRWMLIGQDAPELDGGPEQAITVGCWIYMNVLPTTIDTFPYFIVHGPSSSLFEYKFYANADSGSSLSFDVCDDPSATPTSHYAYCMGGSLSATTWYYVMGGYDPSSNKLYILINDVVVQTTNWTTGMYHFTNSLFHVGGCVNPIRTLNGIVDEVSVWNRVLTTAERTALYNGGSGLTYPFTGTDSLLTGLSGYWSLNESDVGLRYDAASTNDLTPTPILWTETGKIVNAVYSEPTVAVLEAPDSPGLSTGDIDFTVAGWINPASTPAASSFFVSKGSDDLDYPGLEWRVYVDTAKRLNFQVGDGVSHTATATSSALTLGAWTFFRAWHNKTANTVNVQLNAGTTNSTAYTFGSLDSTNVFRVFGALSRQGLGAVDEVGIWKRLLTTDEVSRLTNSTTYPFVP